jgi:surface protein
MFKDCEKLTTIDVTNLKISENVKLKNVFKVDKKTPILVLTNNNALLNYQGFESDNRTQTTININDTSSVSSRSANSINLYAINPNGDLAYFKELLKEVVPTGKELQSAEFDINTLTINATYKDKTSTSVYQPSVSISVESKPSIEFSDIANSTEKDKIEEFVSKGYLNGYGDNTFRPTDQMTRAEFIKLVNRVFDLTEKGTQSFKDVNSSAWYYDELLIAMKAGYINGYDDNTFRPNDTISREEIAVIIARITGIKANSDVNFADSNKVSSWATDAVNAVYDKGIVSGYSDNTFRPQSKAERQHVVKMLYNASKK